MTYAELKIVDFFADELVEEACLVHVSQGRGGQSNEKRDYD